jgi:hypothetical protein
MPHGALTSSVAALDLKATEIAACRFSDSLCTISKRNPDERNDIRGFGSGEMSVPRFVSLTRATKLFDRQASPSCRPAFRSPHRAGFHVPSLIDSINCAMGRTVRSAFDAASVSAACQSIRTVPSSSMT